MSESIAVCDQRVTSAGKVNLSSKITITHKKSYTTQSIDQYHEVLKHSKREELEVVNAAHTLCA